MNAVGFGVSALIGLTVGAIELAGKYRSDPLAALRCPPGWLYLAINAAASAGAYGAAFAFGWRFALPSSAGEGTVVFTRTLVAGFGAMALLRSSLFVLRQGSASVEAGPAGALASLRSTVE